MLGVIERITDLFNYISGEEIKPFGRMHERAFIRDSPLNLENSIMLHLNKHGLTNHMELRNYFNKINGFSVTKQAFSKSREKLDPNVFKILNKHLLSQFYDSDEVKTIKDNLILSGDGSKNTLPYHKSLIPIFGGIKNKYKELTSVAINLTTVHDCLNDFIIDLELDKYETSEKDLMSRNMKNIWESDYLKHRPKIFLYDRGFPSLTFFMTLMENNEKFVFRIKKNSYKSEKAKMKTDDEFIDINITKGRTNHIKNKEIRNKLLKIEKLNLRVTKILLPSGEEEHILSNLNMETFTKKDIKELYDLRWGIEVSYDSLKNLLDVENISGYSKIAVQQDFLSQMLAYNITTDIENNAQKLFDKKQNPHNITNDKKKKINKNIAIGIIKEDLIPIAKIPDENLQKTKLKEIIEEISKYYTKTSTIKSQRKPKRIYSAKNRSNNRKSF